MKRVTFANRVHASSRRWENSVTTWHGKKVLTDTHPIIFFDFNLVLWLLSTTEGVYINTMNNQSPLRVGIVGCGIAGAALAVALEKEVRAVP